MVKILDPTLREGILQPGLYFNKNNNVTIASALAEVGTPRIEFPLVYTRRGGKVEDVKDAVDAVQNNYDKTAVLQFRAYMPDLEQSQVYGARGCALFLAPTAIQRRDKLSGMKQQKVIETFIETLTRAKELGYTYRRATLEDVSRFDNPEEREEEDTTEFLARLLRAVSDAGATIISVPDTDGILSQDRCVPFIKKLARYVDRPLACHFHNDYGNALGNALQAVKVPQVEEVHASILGLGARNGITDHYELVANLEDLLHIETGERRAKMRWLYDTFSNETGIPIPWNHPLAPQCFVERAGTHQKQALKNPKGIIHSKKYMYDSGGTFRFEAGPFMSKSVVQDLLKDYCNDQSTVLRVTEAIAGRSALIGRELKPVEVSRIIRDAANIDVPTERVSKLIYGEDIVHIYVKLKGQPSRTELEEMALQLYNWGAREVDHLYGAPNMDMEIKSPMRGRNGTPIVDMFRQRYSNLIDSTLTATID